MMTNEEVKKHIETEVSEICDKIADLYDKLWEQFLINQGGMDCSLYDDKKQLDVECDELCKRVKALGRVKALVELIQHFRNETEKSRESEVYGKEKDEWHQKK